MAPVKRSSTTAHRETRTTRAATVAKKNAISTEKKTEPLKTTKKVAKAVPTATATRKTRRAVEEEENEAPIPEDASEGRQEVREDAKPARARSTRATASSTSLTVAPRRRVKVTPLDAATAPRTTAGETAQAASHKTTETATKKTSTRSKRPTAASAVDSSATVAEQEVSSKVGQKASVKSKEDRSTAQAPPKARGRPKSQKIEEKTSETTEPEIKITTRTTRSRRAESNASMEPHPQKLGDSSSTNVKAATAVRKKVTFQDLLEENDKENQPLPQAKGKKASATGLRAKPLRKAAAIAPSTRARKTAPVATSTGRISKSTAQDKQGSKMPRALTPKKITQVAKSSSPEHELEISEGEDELNGGKTPIRDLSVSPRRPSNVAIAQAMSPMKKLDFGPKLAPRSPEKTAVFRDTEAEQTGVLASPARRPAALPYKGAIQESPRRGLQEAAKFLFPASNETSTSIVAAASTTNFAPQIMSTMLQSPKRTGVLDPSFFSQSAMKKSASKSPFKSSLFGTPAKRLFSPAKKSTTLPTEIVTEADVAKEHGEAEDTNMGAEVSASSHFCSSLSPLRPVRIDPDTAGFDFDDSILQIRSPLKIQKSPTKQSTTPQSAINDQNDQGKFSNETREENTVHLVEPASLTISPIVSKSNDDQMQALADGSALSHGQITADDANDIEETVQTTTTSPSQPDSTRRPSLAQMLFRSDDAASEEESSEDELAGDRTPVRPQPRARPHSKGSLANTRMSTGVAQSARGKGFGFTPLAAQMSGWLASSPEKSPEQGHNATLRRESAEFSPLARQHVDGEVVISRDSTPVQKLNNKALMQPPSSSKLAVSARKTQDLRRSLAQRQSIGVFSSAESPARNALFDEYMEIRAMEDQVDAEDAHEESPIEMNDDDFDKIMDIEGHPTHADGDDTILEEEDDLKDQRLERSPSDLTTDLINFTHASDTAMVDFQKLAEEANGMASDSPEHDAEEKSAEASTEPVLVEDVALDTLQAQSPIASLGTGFRKELSTPVLEFSRSANGMPGDIFASEEIVGHAPSPSLQPYEEHLESPSILVIDPSEAPSSPTAPAISSAINSPAPSVELKTPQPNLRINKRRVINTVVSKIPLKPEGAISPIKVSKKRSRSFGNSDASPPKRMSFEELRPLRPSNEIPDFESPDRRVRTSVAPSPGGTSTPATCRSNATRASRYSLGSATTPGQMSFAVDDFGDSTLDGIELPEDFDAMTEVAHVKELPEMSEMDMATPKAPVESTPATAKRSARRATTPATATKKTPRTARKTPARASEATVSERTPLKPVGNGVLHGASVFVDVHTSEGADASGIFVELLAQMGAKCIRDWRWNPRASMAAGADSESSEHKVGITHVVYKDGGKRTLEKVRDAKGEVCCVGVAWVLDCEREGKWLDESNYSIDTSILPRGGSNRRKSMEPRALQIATDGSVSASRPRRSVSAEMNELMKRELVNTPARGQPKPVQQKSAHDDESEDDDEADENVEQTTPTGFVSYDPRTAMTPGTPYLVSQGKKLTQMSAPPKQQHKSLFDHEDEENDDTFLEGEKGNAVVVKDAKKFRMKNLGNIAANRRRTLGFKPVVGSPLGRS